ncbi:SUKH-3 domain-containing protein [Streptomyces hydrogenans]|uniref:SUKH-3 domain-containing protein n=1 Tax=Streptomyces hydrogenans TaxID=1873719 RepID=UPI00278C2149|nr:SUKH-3 domain-containing protein [Streptomyces hydrogenans]
MITALSGVARRTLMASGWRPDRNDPALAEELVMQVNKAQRKRREGITQPFPRLTEALSCYGGLEVFNYGPGVTAHRENFSLVPVRGMVSAGVLDELREMNVEKERFFPLGEIPEIHSKLLIGESGKVVLYGPNGYFLMGVDVNDALSNLVAGIEPEYFSG